MEPTLLGVNSWEGTRSGSGSDHGGLESQLGFEETKCIRERSDSMASTLAVRGSLDNIPHLCKAPNETPISDVVWNYPEHNSGNSGISNYSRGEDCSDVDVVRSTQHEIEAPTKVIRISGMSSRVANHGSSVDNLSNVKPSSSESNRAGKKVTYAKVKNRINAIKCENETMRKFIHRAQQILATTFETSSSSSIGPTMRLRTWITQWMQPIITMGRR